MSDPPPGESSSTNEDTSSSSLLKQTLMTVDECFVYKIPPLATSGGYRAEQWDLANPLQTCGFQVERRQNDLYLLFTTESHTQLFALAHIEQAENIQRRVEAVLDSSRYFVTHIQNQTGRKALIGFGFRDRELALDLLGTLQQFQKSIAREVQAKTMKVAAIPVLKEGERMHIQIAGMEGKKKKSATTAAASSHSSGGGKPILLKKPPKSAAVVEAPVPTQAPQQDPDNDDDDDDWDDFQQA